MQHVLAEESSDGTPEEPRARRAHPASFQVRGRPARVPEEFLEVLIQVLVGVVKEPFAEESDAATNIHLRVNVERLIGPLRAVKEAEALGKDLAELPLEVLRGYSALVSDDVHGVLSPEGSVASRNHIGGTAPAQVRLAAQRARARLG